MNVLWHCWECHTSHQNPPVTAAPAEQDPPDGQLLWLSRWPAYTQTLTQRNAAMNTVKSWNEDVDWNPDTWGGYWPGPDIHRAHPPERIASPASSLCLDQRPIREKFKTQSEMKTSTGRLLGQCVGLCRRRDTRIPGSSWGWGTVPLPAPQELCKWMKHCLKYSFSFFHALTGSWV